MKLCRIWLLALMSIMALVATSTFAIAEDAAHTSGSVEIGATGTDLDDFSARVNEYVKQRDDQGFGVAVKLDLEFTGFNNPLFLIRIPVPEVILVQLKNQHPGFTWRQ